MHLKIIKRIDDYGTDHTLILIFCSPRAKPKFKTIEQIPYQSIFINISGFIESMSIYVYKQKIKLSFQNQIPSYHARLHLLAWPYSLSLSPSRVYVHFHQSYSSVGPE